MKRRWDIQASWNPWLSLGVHFDHTDPSITFHMPLVILAAGRLKQPGFREDRVRRQKFERMEALRLDMQRRMRAGGHQPRHALKGPPPSGGSSVMPPRRRNE